MASDGRQRQTSYGCQSAVDRSTYLQSRSVRMHDWFTIQQSRCLRISITQIRAALQPPNFFDNRLVLAGKQAVRLSPHWQLHLCCTWRQGVLCAPALPSTPQHRLRVWCLACACRTESQADTAEHGRIQQAPGRLWAKRNGSSRRLVFGGQGSAAAGRLQAGAAGRPLHEPAHHLRAAAPATAATYRVF